MDFPTTEPQIAALAEIMVSGYRRHLADFPHITIAGRTKLYVMYSKYMAQRKAAAQAFAALRIATKAKNNRLQSLKKVMKQSLQKSQVDVAANPEKLKLIGWAPKANPQPAQLPAQPTNLQITAKEDRIVSLNWDRPKDGQRVRNYCIERRQQNGEGFDNWIIVHISYYTKATLRNQPSGVQLEYRIRAANNAGTGPASNTAAIVL